MKVLIVGATGSIGRLATAEAIRQGHQARAFARDAGQARTILPAGVQIVEGDLTDTASLAGAVDGVDAVIFTHGSHGGPGEGETIDYGGVRNTLHALSDRPARIVLMTAISVTDRVGAHDWKRRAERLVRASGRPYTIVRPGWFDYNEPDQHRLVMLQGDRRNARTPEDGVVARRQLAEVLVAALTAPDADRKTFELVADHGPAPAELQPLFKELAADPPGSLDGAADQTNMPLDDEPENVQNDLHATGITAAGRS